MVIAEFGMLVFQKKKIRFDQDENHVADSSIKIKT